MNFEPFLACGPDLSTLLFAVAPVGNCVALFVGGAICSAMGNKKIGTGVMMASASLGSVLVLAMILG